MKSKRRHELQTNQLADQLGQWIDWLRPHLATFALVALSALLILVVWFYWASNKENLVTQAWRAYMLAGSNPAGDMAKELNTIADKFSDTQAGLWAAQTAADIEAGQAVRRLFNEKATAETGLDTAIKGYQAILDNKLIKNSPMLERRAHFGLAQSLEASGDLKRAIEHYQAVIGAAPDSALAKAAQRRADLLAEENTKEWYDWFAQQTPASRLPEGGLPPADDLGRPASDLETLPEAPGDDFMKGVDGDATESAPASTTPEAAEPSTDAGTTGASTPESPVEAPKVDGPAVEPPKVEPAKEAGSDASSGGERP